MSMLEVSETGGARIGNANISWPFAALTVNATKFELNAGIMGKLVFRPMDILSIEPYESFISRGIKIKHNVPSYKDHVVFWSFENYYALIKQINDTGFLTNPQPMSEEDKDAIIEFQLRGPFPIKAAPTIIISTIWIVLLFVNFWIFLILRTPNSLFGPAAQLAFGFTFLLCVLLLSSKPFGKLILKKGYEARDIYKFMLILILVSSMLLISAIS